MFWLGTAHAMNLPITTAARVAGVEVEGEVLAGAVDLYFTRITRGQFLGCFQEWVDDGGYPADHRLVVQYTMDAQGRVLQAEPLEHDFENTWVPTCVAELSVLWNERLDKGYAPRLPEGKGQYSATVTIEYTNRELPPVCLQV